MSVSGRVIFAKVIGQTDANTLQVSYEYVPPVFVNELSHIDGGSVSVNISGMTETEINAKNQQAVMDQANSEVPEELFVLADVRGGRF